MSGRRRRGQRSVGDLRTAILQLFATEPDRGFKVKEIQRALGVPHSRYRELRSEVVELARAGRIGTLPRRRYGSLAVARFLEGTVEGVGQRATHVRMGDGSASRWSPRPRRKSFPATRSGSGACAKVGRSWPPWTACCEPHRGGSSAPCRGSGTTGCSRPRPPFPGFAGAASSTTRWRRRSTATTIARSPRGVCPPTTPPGNGRAWSSSRCSVPKPTRRRP